MIYFKLADDLTMRGICTMATGMACLLTCHPSSAEQLVFTIDPTSSLTGSAFVVPVLTAAGPQDENGDSVTTTFSGTITVDVDDLANPTSIQFVSASAAAANSGNWLPALGGGSEGDPEIDGDADPGEPAPANFGWYLDAGAVGQLYAASRDTVFSLGADPIPLTGGAFDPFGIAVTVPQGLYETNISSLVFGDDAGSSDLLDAVGSNCTDMDGMADRCAGAMGNYSVAGDVATLTLPLDFILGEATDVEVTFVGTFTATASLVEELVGDYNNDGAVDAADYTVWRDTLGQTGPDLPADGDNDLEVNEGDYDLWKANFGEMLAGATIGFSPSTAPMPEPTTIALLATAVMAMLVRHRRR